MKLASTVQQLSEEVLRLKTALSSANLANQSPPKDANCRNTSRKSYAAATMISIGESGHASASTAPNVQVHSRLQSDLSSVVSVLSKLDNNIQPQSIKDCYHLGKFFC